MITIENDGENMTPPVLYRLCHLNHRVTMKHLVDTIHQRWQLHRTTWWSIPLITIVTMAGLSKRLTPMLTV